MAERGKPMTIWSDYDMNFVGAVRELKDHYTHLGNAQKELTIGKFSADQGIQWSFAPERAPHFGVL